MAGVKGAFKRNPSRGRARENELKSEGEIEGPPAHLHSTVAACWHEIVGLTHPGVLCRADRLIVEHAAHILALLREGDWTGNRALLTRLDPYQFQQRLKGIKGGSTARWFLKGFY